MSLFDNLRPQAVVKLWSSCHNPILRVFSSLVFKQLSTSSSCSTSSSPSGCQHLWSCSWYKSLSSSGCNLTQSKSFSVSFACSKSLISKQLSKYWEASFNISTSINIFNLSFPRSSSPCGSLSSRLPAGHFITDDKSMKQDNVWQLKLIKLVVWWLWCGEMWDKVRYVQSSHSHQVVFCFYDWYTICPQKTVTYGL